MTAWTLLMVLLLVDVLRPTLVDGAGTGSKVHLIRHHTTNVKSKKSEVDTESNDIKSGDASTSLTPSTSSTLHEIIVAQHQLVRLDCLLPPDVAPMHFTLGISWVRNDNAVDTVDLGMVDQGHRYSKSQMDGHLVISHLRLEDDGYWQCQYRRAPADPPVKSELIKLTVLDRPRNPYLLIDGRRLDPGNLFIPVKESTSLSVSCVVEGGNPAPTIQWDLILSPSLDPLLIGEEAPAMSHLNITQPSATDNKSRTHGHTRSDARVDVMRRHHNGTVMCLAHHATLTTALNASLLLDVQYSPSFAISREPGFGFPIREGIPVSLKCDVDSNPMSSPVWQKDDGPPPVAQSGDGYLNFSSIKREDSGWYKCTSHHVLGDFSSIGYFLNVRYDPVVEVTAAPADSALTGRHVEVPLGGAVQLQCPQNTHGCWSKVSGTGRVEAVGPGPGLALEDVLYQDAGEYRCVSSKSSSYDKWRSELNVDVTVKGRPAVYPSNTNVTAYTGQPLDLSVELCANPPATKVFWVTDTLRLLPGQVTKEFIVHNLTNGSSIHCQEALLTVKKVKPSHEGEYMALVRSPKGLADGSITVNVMHVSGYSSPASIKTVNQAQLLAVLCLILTIVKNVFL